MRRRQRPDFLKLQQEPLWRDVRQRLQKLDY